MAIKTTDTTNVAGCSPCTPEAHQRASGKPETTCYGCIHLTEQQDNVGWCAFHWQYRSINLERTCEGAQFFGEEA